MATTTYKTNRKTGLPQAVITLAPGERAVILKPGQGFLVHADGGHYRLGGQLGDIVADHVLKETERVRWCSIEQAWISYGEKAPEVVQA